MKSADAEHLSTGQSAKLLSVTPDTVLKWIKRGRLPAVRTAGGHYRVAREHIESLLQERHNGEAGQHGQGLVYCWEYYADGGRPREQCTDCIVYKARALRCFEMSDLPPESGYAGTFCKTSCDECPYYLDLMKRPRRVLVVTDSVRLRERLQSSDERSRLELEFASCEYECSMIVDRFKPEYVLLDCTLPDNVCNDLCRHLATDPRIPGVRIVMASESTEADGESNGGVVAIPRPLSLAELEEYIAGARLRAREENRAASV